MATTEFSKTASTHALPDPGERVPALAVPTVLIFFGALIVFIVSTTLAIRQVVPSVVTILVNAVVCFVMFTVAHDAAHYSISRVRWVNSLFGRLSTAFVSPVMAFPVFCYLHIEHHRHANDDANDPDTFASHGKGVALPVHLALMDLAYVPFYLRRIRSRPAAEIAELAALILASVAGLAVAIATGNFWLLAVIYIIPERIAVFFLAWWFDWLPHHGLEDTQRGNRYRATRARVGMEWLFTPLMLSQNYHLVHHLHPSIPFYRYLKVWRRNESAYLERNAAITTVFGDNLNSEEYREWKELNNKLLRVLPVRMPQGSSAPHGVFHRIPVASVDPVTKDATLITFGVPENLKDEFRFEPGQHVTVRTDLGGEGVRRNYSICAPATRAMLRIAVKHIPQGAFSTFVAEDLRAGDVLELMTPTGRFGSPLHPLNRKTYAAIAAGSGITPLLSIVETTLEIETESRFTLVYGNRTKDSTMFRQELDSLESRYSDRLEILHVLSKDPLHTAELQGRIDEPKLEKWMKTILQPETVDDWFVCGPMEMTTTVRNMLVERGVVPERIHVELFFGFTPGSTASSSRTAAQSATVGFTLSGREETFELSPGDSLLEGALQRRPDAPYACMGGACGTCRAKLVEGTVEMDQNFALGQADLEAGWILTCQSHPTSPTIKFNYDG